MSKEPDSQRVLDFRAELEATLLTEKQTFEKVMGEMGGEKKKEEVPAMMALETMHEAQQE